MLAGTGPAQAQPNPILYLTGLEYYTVGGKNFIRYRYDVFNKDQYPAAMFARGAGPAALRHQHQFVAHLGRFLRVRRGKRLYGFCALGSPNDLG